MKEFMPGRARRLPHNHAEARALFLTWHLHGSLPVSRFPPPGELESGQLFVWIDRYLDSTRTGHFYLRNPQIAKIVVDSIQFGCESLRHYELHAYAVMGNHVHLLITPLVPLSKLQQALKGFTAREANKILGRTGMSFWQRESYDHWVRDAQEFLRIKAYIERNPVKAGMVNCAAAYRWSSAWVEPGPGLDAAGGALATGAKAGGAILAGAGGEDT
jgi:type I restriction enzyme R subunit/putative DNA methylase